MRTVLLLFMMCLSTAVFAKKKARIVDANAVGTIYQSLDNTDLALASAWDGLHGHSAYFPHVFGDQNHPILNDNVYQVYTDHFFDNGEFSYNSSFNLSGGGSFSSLSTTVLPEKASLDYDTLFSQGLFYGFTGMLILLNLMCFFLFSEKTFLYYGLSLTGFTILLFLTDGLMELLLIDINRIIPFETTVMFIATALHAVFASRFLTLREFAPKLKYVSFFMMGVALVACLFNWITSNPVMAQVANLSLFAVAASYFLTGVSLFSRKNYAKFYVIATFIPMLFALDFFILKPLGLEFLGVATGHLKGAAIAEMLILTYGIVYRMQAIKEENELRQVEMRIFLKRQEIMNTRRKTEKLVEEVYLENLIMHYDLDGLEIKLLQYISEGKENVKIARKLKMSESDVEDLTKELYLKLEIGEQIQQDYRLVDQQPDYIYN